MKNYCIVLLLLLCRAAYAQPVVITSPLDHPESIASDGKFLYATLIGKALAPTAKDGDGGLCKLDLSGKVIDAHFNKEPLNAPKGTALLGNKLYIADIDRLVVIDLSSGNKVDEIDMAATGSVFLNDIAVMGDSVLFVSATDIGQIFKVSLAKPNKVAPLSLPKILGPNGLVFDSANNTLYVAGLDRSEHPAGELGMITFKGNACHYETLTDAKGVFDGIQMIDAHTLIVSDWVNIKLLQSRLLKVNLRDKSYTELYKGTDAADIYYDKKKNRIIQPGLRDGVILEYSLNRY
ncbi:YncE family protein [Ohtaekwangia sp.]|uniref:YncE family protein n=1 Tax=Ohtaekwangia sp. TaxID=2066019 RepID=UPI002FDDB657